MSNRYVASLAIVVAALFAVRVVVPQLPLRRIAKRLTAVDATFLTLGVLGLVLHCGSMFFRSTFEHLPASRSAIHAINALGVASKVWYAVPAALVMVGLRRQFPVALVAVGVALALVGLTMYDGGPLRTHLNTIFVTVVLLAAVVAALARPPWDRDPGGDPGRGAGNAVRGVRARHARPPVRLVRDTGARTVGWPAMSTIELPHTDLSLDDIRLGDIEQWMRPDREGIFAKLRAERPVSFHEEPVPPPEIGIPQGPGFWALTRYDDVMQVSRDPDTFHSAPTSTVGDMPPEIAEWLGSMINMDAPKHTKLRLIVNRGFTPRQVAKIEESVRLQAKEIVDRVAPLGECDFVTEIAAALPLQIICDMMGIPRADTKQIFEHTNVILGVGDPEYVNSMDDLMAAGMGLFQYGLALAEDRLANPRDDITTALMHAEIEDENGKHRLTAGELGSFFLLLVVAGNETTRNAISHGMRALTQNPDQRRLWVNDFDAVSPTAVEEIVRWATPVINFRRTATRDVEVGGELVKEGQKVVMFYNSANRDERAFDDPFRFDLTRTPNEHFGFGAGGPHFCLGANLARREIRVMFEELLRRLPDIEITGEPDMLQSNFIHGIKRMPCAWRTVVD